MNAVTAAPASRAGVWAALMAFAIWGCLPVYWKALSQMDPLEIMCQRMVWSFLTLLPVIVATGMLGPVLRIMGDRKMLPGLLASSAILSGNWLLFIWGVNNGMVLETSLGYFINPLINFLLGVIFFREQAGSVARIAVLVAAVGVGYQVFLLGHVPWVALGLGMSFAAYGVIRKVIKVEALPGLFLETTIAFPFALAYLVWLGFGGVSVFFWADVPFLLLLAFSGLLTTLPLFLFAFGVRRIPLTTVGLLQYLSPSMTFLFGIFLFREDFSADRFVTFACIWVALALYTWDSFRNRHERLK